MQKCIFAKQNVMLNILLRKMYAKMHFCIKCIFAQHLCFLQSKKHSIFAQLNILQSKMYAKMHFCIKCIFASNAFLQNKMYASNAFCRFLTFWFAEHFPLENVMLNILQSKMYALRCKNAFLHQMHFGIKCIFASNAFWHQMHFCTAEHFPLENVMLNIWLRKMWCWTFYFVKCTRCWTFSFGKCDAKMHFCTAKMHFAAF